MSLRDFKIKSCYIAKGEWLLQHLLLPLMQESENYDRITSFYTIDSLLAISQGIQSIYDAGGKMRLIIGVHSVPQELVEATQKQEYIKDQIACIRKELKEQIYSLTDLLEKKRLATLAWMIQDGLLEVKAASVSGNGIFHPKTIILTDHNNNRIAAVGSPNETRGGLGSNIEQLVVEKSWIDPEGVETQQSYFDSLWNNTFEGVEVQDISEDTAYVILDALGDKYKKPKGQAKNMNNLIATSYKMPANYFVSGNIPALFMHQERAVIDALSRWPVRVLFADEVGLGKTFEVAASMAYLIKYCGVKRVVILTPKSVISQWQDELINHFKIDSWIYDSSNKKYISANNKVINIGRGNPLGKNAPSIILMSSQYARGNRSSSSVFEREGSILPELLVVDEAHSARVSSGISVKTKTLLYSVLERITKRIPHVIFATATPMQKDADEYHALLNLLGLSSKWSKIRNYQVSLRAISSDEAPSISDASTVASLISETLLYMTPSLRRLDSNEQRAISELQEIINDGDSFDAGNYVINNWTVFRSAFIKLHPAHLLTIRNTRRSLADIGYIFPERNLIEESINDSSAIELYYDRVNQYLTDECFSIEKELYPEHKKAIGFLKLSYQQRVASSLYSCKKSLTRRLEKVKAMEQWLERADYLSQKLGVEFGLNSILDDIDLDDYLALDLDELGEIGKIKSEDIPALKRAVYIESSTLSGLIEEADSLLAEFGDKKIIKSISLSIEGIKSGDAVLVFSRYTDTIDALIEEFNVQNKIPSIMYGIYTGKKSCIVANGVEMPCDKSQIKNELFSGNLSLVFCSDAASEGLNLQAARILINVDVPWTPARLEQRIGRIARLGQVAKVVDIYNVWYPNSIESRMYHRIQKRLEESNLAIGEFPEVVAEKIKKAVLEDADSDSSGIDELKQIRNSSQVSALNELWSIQDSSITTSRYMRECMIRLCDIEFPRVSEKYDSRIITYQLPDGSTVDLSSYEGMPESISLNSCVWNYVDYSANNICAVKNASGVIIAFSINSGEQKGSFINHESIFKIINGERLTKDDYLIGHPQMLPDQSRLSLQYAVDIEFDGYPNLWSDA